MSRAGHDYGGRGYAVVGTDTGVGKTLVAAALAAAGLAQGKVVTVLKPVQTGADTDNDAAEVNRLLGADVAQTLERLRAPLAPSVAARLEERTLQPAQLVAWIDTHSSAADLVIVETAGGCAVEIVEDFDMADLCRESGLDSILVCRPGLGTLNHTLLSVEHLRTKGVDFAGFVICGFADTPGIDELTNPAELERLTGCELVGVVPDVSPSELSSGEFRRLAPGWVSPRLGGTFDREEFLARIEAQFRATMKQRS